MNYHKGMGFLVAALAFGAVPAAFGQDASPEPSAPVQKGAVAEEAQIGTIEAREDDLGVARDEPEQDMHGTGSNDENEAQSGADTGADTEPQVGQGGSERQGESNEFDAPYRDLEPESPGLEEPRQPIRPGQMEQEHDRQE
ncbi:hypothetical protein ACUY1T_16000 [Billgrantia sp. Q4P2]|uniref:hypothetical protein n=1 Tax=Billgrantia sp. Q4P2 TaxID=3463857 RepID=UPI004057BB3E